MMSILEAMNQNKALQNTAPEPNPVSDDVPEPVPEESELGQPTGADVKGRTAPETPETPRNAPALIEGNNKDEAKKSTPAPKNRQKRVNRKPTERKPTYSTASSDPEVEPTLSDEKAYKCAAILPENIRRAIRLRMVFQRGTTMNSIINDALSRELANELEIMKLPEFAKLNDMMD